MTLPSQLTALRVKIMDYDYLLSWTWWFPQGAGWTGIGDGIRCVEFVAAQPLRNCANSLEVFLRLFSLGLSKIRLRSLHVPFGNWQVQTLADKNSCITLHFMGMGHTFNWQGRIPSQSGACGQSHHCMGWVFWLITTLHGHRSHLYPAGHPYPWIC